MNFSNDRDLLLYEPNVFIDVPLIAQQRLRVTTASLSENTLISAAGDFTAAGAGAGGVIIINRVCHEIISRIDAHTLTVSLPRNSLADAPIRSTITGSGLEAILRTFAPQTTIVHQLLLRALGIDANDATCKLTEDSIVSLGAMSRLEILGTLEMIYSQAWALTGDNTALMQRAELYRQRFLRALKASKIHIDANGDGLADTLICPSLVSLRRV